MKKICVIPLIAFALAGCTNLPAQQAQTAPLTVTQMQGQCLSMYKKFVEQATCVERKIEAYPDAYQNPYVQIYQAQLQSLVSQVKKKKITEEEGRLQVTMALSNLRQQQQVEFSRQEEIDSQRNAQYTETLRHIMPEPLQVYRPRTLRTLNTNCYTIGNQVSCSSN